MAVKHPDERWLIAIDIDGTLVHDNGYLSPAVVEQVQRVRALGHLVVVATGRSASNAFPVIKDVGIAEGLAVAIQRALQNFYISRGTKQSAVGLDWILAGNQ